MQEITVYRFHVYDTHTDELRVSKRWGTRRAIEAIRGLVQDDSAVQVDVAVTQFPQSDLPGLTARGFNPHRVHLRLTAELAA